MFNCDLWLRIEAQVVLAHNSKCKNGKNQMCTSSVIARKNAWRHLPEKNKNCQGPTEDQHHNF